MSLPGSRKVGSKSSGVEGSIVQKSNITGVERTKQKGVGEAGGWLWLAGPGLVGHAQECWHSPKS